MNQGLIEQIRNRESVDTHTHSGSYELFQTAIRYYAEFDSANIKIKDAVKEILLAV